MLASSPQPAIYRWACSVPCAGSLTLKLTSVEARSWPKASLLRVRHQRRSLIAAIWSNPGTANFVLIRRIRWRLADGVHLPRAGSSAIDTIATLTHKILYLLLVGTVLLGIANAWIRGDTLFMLLKIPAFDPGNTALREPVEDLHSWAANILLVVAGLHAAAALLHHFVLKDDILRRMVPRR